MSEGTRAALLVDESFAEGVVKWVIAATEEASPDNRIRVGLEAAIEAAETDLTAARLALLELRADHGRLARLEVWLGGSPDRATFGLGAAIQVIKTELSAEEPDLQSLAPALLRWLEGDW